MTKSILGDDPFGGGDDKGDKANKAEAPDGESKSAKGKAAAKGNKKKDAPAAAKKETVAPPAAAKSAKTETVAPPAAAKSAKAETVAPPAKKEPIAPPAAAKAAKVETIAPPAAKAEPVAPPVAAKSEPVAPPVAAKAEPVAPPVAAKVEPATPPVAAKAEPVAPPVAAKAEPVAPPVAAKVEPVAPPIAAKVEPVTPAVAAKAEPVVPPIAAKVEPVAPPVAAEAVTRATAPSAAPTPTTRAETDEYGPTINRPPPAGHRQGILEEVRHLEERVRQSIAPETRRAPSPVLGAVWRAWRDLAMRDRSDSVDEFGRDPSVAARVDPLLDFLYQRYFRVESTGLGHIPDTGRALIVANHSGTLPYDGAMIMQAVRREHEAHRSVRPLVEDFVFHFPYLGTLMNRIGGVRACQENATRLLENDQLVAVFPEGIKGVGKLFAQRYQLQRFGRGGFIKLALSTDAPIIPTAVVGAEEIHPMLTKITWLAKSFGIPYLPITPTFPWLGPVGLVPLPTKWFIAFGEPLYFNAEYGAEAASDRILVNKLAEQVRQRIQEMIDQLLRDRRSVVFG